MHPTDRYSPTIQSPKPSFLQRVWMECGKKLCEDLRLESPGSRSPPPSQMQTVLGACFVIQNFPQHPMNISITERRRYTSHDSDSEGSTDPASIAGQVRGKLQHASCMLWRRYGSAKLHSFSRRQHVNPTALNFQLIEALHWWIDVPRCPLAPREVVCNLQHLHHYVPYSDDEGSITCWRWFCVLFCCIFTGPS